MSHSKAKALHAIPQILIFYSSGRSFAKSHFFLFFVSFLGAVSAIIKRFEVLILPLAVLLPLFGYRIYCICFSHFVGMRAIGTFLF